MDLPNIIVLSLIVTAFVVFALTLAWAIHCTEDARRQVAPESVQAKRPSSSVFAADDRRVA